MVSRLVLGCGAVGQSLARSLARSGGRSADSLLVLTDDTHRVETLRNENITAERADVTDAAVVREHAADVDTVVVGGDNPAENLAATRAARESYPGAFLLAYTGRHPSKDEVAALERLADRTVEPGATTADAVMERAGAGGIRMRRLRRVLRSVDEPLAIVAHDNPDPDAIASAIALHGLAVTAGCEAEVVYAGNISHQENRALVNLLDYELTRVDRDADFSRFGGFALVDHSRPGVNDPLPEDTPVDIVIDHHPPRAPVEARFVDLRSHVGATSTLLTGYLERLNVEPTAATATGLLFGIQVDTDDFTREVAREDFEAAAFLLEYVDSAALERIESPSISPETLDIVGRAVTNREIHDDILTTCVDAIGDRDALAQAADRLLDMEGVSVVLVYGYMDGTVYASARARGTDVDLGETLRDAFGQIGSAGGHADMAGAQVPVGMLVEDPESEETDRGRIIREVVEDRFFEALGITTDSAAEAVYARGDYLGTTESGPVYGPSIDDSENDGASGSAE